MLKEIDAYLALSDQQKKAYSLLERASFGYDYPLSIVQNEEVMKKLIPEIERLESSEEDGFNKYIQYLMSFQLPQPQTENWN